MEALGVATQAVEPGLIECAGDLAIVHKLNLHLRTASRVLMRLGVFNAAAFSELHKKASRLPWKNYLAPGQAIAVRVTTHASRLYHKKGVAERVAKAVSDAVGGEVVLSAGDDDEGRTDAQLIVVRLIRNMCTISIDTSGEHLHRRGYRLEIAKAPLRETLAAAIVMASGWDRTSPLVDPFCGSGTIPVEAAMIAAGIPPGLGRDFAFMHWPVAKALPPVEPAARLPIPPLFGYDRDDGAIRAARANAERAGLAGVITFERRSISDLALPEIPGWIVTNPPYGERVKGGPDLRNLYARTGTVWRERAAAWHIYMISSSPRWLGQMNMAHATVSKFNNGGIPVNLVRMLNV